MADAVFGVVASAFAVASLAIQLLDVLQTVHSSWHLLDSSDANIKHIKDYLSLLETISITIIEDCKNEPSITCGKVVIQSLNGCMSSAQLLNNLIVDHQTNQGHRLVRRRWSIIKVALKDKTIQRIESQLDRDVKILLLALQPFFHRINRQHFTSLAAITTSSLAHPDTQDRSKTQILDDASGLTLERLRSGKSFVGPASKGLPSNGRLVFSSLDNRRWSFKFDSYTIIERIVSSFGFSIPTAWREIFQGYLFGVTYASSNHQLNLLPEESHRANTKRRLKVMLPMFSFQIQSSTLPWTLISHPIVPCQSQIFKLCADGNLDAVRVFLNNSWVSPFAVNQHGENLLHAAARYAHADLCWFLLDIGVDGSAYDDRLLTPLDHLAQKVCSSFEYPSRVVDTIRALVERGKCQPLLPLTSNAVSFYRGPEEGFAWLFSSEYAGVDLEERDSEGWTLLGDAAFNFGWWTVLGVEDPAVCWQSLYLLRAGADPHRRSSEGGLTPLDTFLRGCTVHQVDHARRWLLVVARSGLDLHEYARAEKDLHASGHYLSSSWDEDLWKWIPTKQLVLYKFGESSDELEIWLDDYDALSWFGCGRFDLDMFQICAPPASLRRWRELNAKSDFLDINEIQNGPECLRIRAHSRHKAINDFLRTEWFHFLVATLFVNYAFHLVLTHSQRQEQSYS